MGRITSLRLIVGLGNLGRKYKNNRHNVGFIVLEKLKNQILNSQFSILNESPKFQNSKKFQVEILKIGGLVLAKPTTFMNSSGVAVKKLTNAYCLIPSALYVVHDDLDIKLGEYKIQFGKGPKVHNGISSIEKKLGTKDFWRVRVGIENRMVNGQWLMVNGKQGKISGESYVLQDFEESEIETRDRVIGEVVEELLKLTLPAGR